MINPFRRFLENEQKELQILSITPPNLPFILGEAGWG